MPAAAIRYAGFPISSRPPKRTEPSAFASSPVSAAQRVDLPIPLRPITATGSSPISKLTPCRTWAAP